MASKPHKILGVEFAPLSLPMERRLQTLAVFTYMGLFLTFASLWTLTMTYLLVFTSFKWIPLLYAAWYLYDRETGENGGRKRL